MNLEAMKEVSHLPVEIRVLRGCRWCGMHIMDEAKFLEWIKAPTDAECQHCGWVRPAPVIEPLGDKQIDA